MEIPNGIENVDKRNFICKLQKALYGLSVSPKRWYTKFKEVMLRFNFVLYPFQSCIFTWSDEGKIIFVSLYADNILIIGNCLIAIEKFKLH